MASGIETRLRETAVRAALLSLYAVVGGACDPVVLDIGPVATRSGHEEGPDLGSVSGMSDAAAVVDAGASVPDAQTDARSDPVDSSAPDAAELDCTRIGDFEPADATAPKLLVRTATELSCEPSDEGGPARTPVYSRQDGATIMSQGGAYSLRWDGAALTRLRLLGGPQPCDTTTVYDETLSGLGLPSQGCRDLVPQLDVAYVRLPDLIAPDFGLTINVVEVCATSCPAP